MFKGSYVALITPFKNGKVDESKLKELVEWHISEGTKGIVPVGTTGESATLSHKEHARVIEVVVKAVNGRIPVIAGAGSNSTREAVDLTKEAKRLGADGVLSVNPYYNRPTQEGLKSHFGAIARATSLPVVLYNIPSRTGVQLTVDTVVSLAKKHKNIKAIKESTGNIDVASEIRARLGNDFTIISGDDSLTLPILSIGGSGVISVAANLVPKTVQALCQAWFSGNSPRATELHLKLFPLVKALFLETNPGPVKAAMKIAGLIKDSSLRLPLVAVSSHNKDKIKLAMQTFGVKNG
ncbi:MAG: 4-hydroxy-tetrahydrodipicolinate synthase [Elusimicrobiota bacterium]